jgi:flagellar motor switch protein FliG
METNRGIEAYQKTMNTQSQTPSTDDEKALLKTTTEPLPEDSKIRRVAKFLILIGSSQAAKILCELDPEQVEQISQEIATIKTIGPGESGAILAEFKSLLSSPLSFFSASTGGVEAARDILYAAYGPEKGEALLNKTVPNSKENIFGFLEEFSPEQLVFLFKDESPVTVALILARLPAKVSAETLKKFPPALKPEILKCIAHQNEVSPEVLERVAAAIRERARHLGSSSQDIEIDGMQTLAAILKQGDYSFGDRLINELESDDPDIGKDLKERIYTLDDVLAVIDHTLAEKLRTMTEQTIAILLKGRSAEFCEKILSNVSSGRRTLIREEGEILGAVSKRERDAVASDFMTWFRMAREKGDLALSGDKDWVE